MNKYKNIYRAGFEKRCKDRQIYLELARKYGDSPLAMQMLAKIEARQNFIVSY
jgi:hypothetical protein